MGADEVEVQLAQRSGTHVGIPHHAARNDARLLHDAVLGHAELLHIGQVSAVLQIGAGNGAHLRHPAAQDRAARRRQDIGRRHIHRPGRIGQHGFLEARQLVHGRHDGVGAGPLPIIVPVAVVRLRQHQRLMVVAVKAQLPALPQQQPAVILELPDIALAGGRGLGVVAVVFDHDAGVPDAIPFRQPDKIRPPDFCVKFRDAQPVLLADVLAVALRHRGREVVQKEDRAVEHRVGARITQQAVGGRVKAPHHLIIDADVVHHDPALAQFRAPHQRHALVPGDGIDRGIVPQPDPQRRFEWVAEFIPLPAAQHEARGGDDALGHLVAPRRGQHPQFLRHGVERAGFFQRHGKEDVSALLHPVHQVQQP